MNRSFLHKLLLARRLYELAREQLWSASDLSLCIGVNLLQDAVEAFLIAVSEYVNAQVTPRTSFDQYFDLINAKINPNELPFRSRLVSLNKLRVNSKHHGISPSHSEVEGLLVVVREFFDEVSDSVLKLSFATVTLVDLVRDGEAKELLREAERSYGIGDFENCIISCRKAIFVRIEQAYDVSGFAEDKPPRGVLAFGSGFRAPFFAKSKEYIDKNVKDATDYIVLDYHEVDMELMKSGMDSVSFWNVWRLTPEVYRHGPKDEWIVKRHLRKLEKEGIKERAEYVLDTTVSLFVAADQKRAGIRDHPYRKYYVRLREDQVPVYEKADVKSTVVATTPEGLTELSVDFSVSALNGDGMFWYVDYFSERGLVMGYIEENMVAELRS